MQKKILIYQSLIESHCNYLTIIYGFKRTNEFKSLQRLQNKALKIVANLPILFPTVSLYKNIFPQVLPIYGIYKQQLLVYVYKCLQNFGHHTIHFVQNQNIFNTRNINNLKVFFCQSETTKQRIEHSGSKEYNNLPMSIKNATSISQFKSLLKKYLMEHIDDLLI